MIQRGAMHSRDTSRPLITDQSVVWLPPLDGSTTVPYARITNMVNFYVTDDLKASCAIGPGYPDHRTVTAKTVLKQLARGRNTAEDYDQAFDKLAKSQIPAHIIGDKIAIRVNGPHFEANVDPQQFNAQVSHQASRLAAAIELAERLAKGYSPPLKLVLWTYPGISERLVRILDKVRLCDDEQVKIIDKSLIEHSAGPVYYARRSSGTRYMTRSQVLSLLEIIDNPKDFKVRIESMLVHMNPECRNIQGRPEMEFLVLDTQRHENDSYAHRKLFDHLEDNAEQILAIPDAEWQSKKEEIIRFVIALVSYQEYLETGNARPNDELLKSPELLKEDLSDPDYRSALENVLLNRKPQHHFDLGYSTPLQSVEIGYWEDSPSGRKFKFTTSNNKHIGIIKRLIATEPSIAKSDYINLYLPVRPPTYDQLRLTDAKNFGEQPDVSYFIFWGTARGEEDSLVIREHSYPPAYWKSHDSPLVKQLVSTYNARALTELYSLLRNYQGQLLNQLGAKIMPFETFRIKKNDDNYYWKRKHVMGAPLDSERLIEYDFTKLVDLSARAVRALVPGFLSGRQSYYFRELYLTNTGQVISIGTTGAFFHRPVTHKSTLKMKHLLLVLRFSVLCLVV